MMMGVASPAVAASEPSAGPVTEDDEEVPPGMKPDAPATAEPKAPPPVHTDQPTPPEDKEVAVGLVERLPPSAYPAPYVRGLHGGSMWLNSQGVQWPYLPRTTIGVSGYAWLDTNYKALHTGDPNGKDRKELLSQGRMVLRVTPTYSHGDWFVQAQAELVANKEQITPSANADVDDLWIRFGKWKAFDITVGRFEAFEVYHLGMGLDLNTDERRGAYDPRFSPPDLYQASFLFLRPESAGDIAIHAYPTQFLRFEFLGQTGNFGGLRALGARPAAIFDIGWLKLKAAGEYQVANSPEVSGSLTKQVNRGFAGSAQFVIDPYVEFGGNVGHALVDNYDNLGNLDTGRSITKTSFGGFLNARIVPDLLLGVGVNDVKQTDQHFNTDNRQFGEATNFQSYAALQYFWESQLMVKLVVGHATADNRPSFASMPSYSNSLYSARLRFQFLF